MPDASSGLQLKPHHVLLRARDEGHLQAALLGSLTFAELKFSLPAWGHVPYVCTCCCLFFAVGYIGLALIVVEILRMVQDEDKFEV